MDDVDNLRAQALRVLAWADAEPDSTEVIRLRRSAARMIEFADRIEQGGASIMTEQPTLRQALRLVR